MEPITINGKSGTVSYFDADWKLTDNPANATFAKVLFDDGSVAFYSVSDS